MCARSVAPDVFRKKTSGGRAYLQIVENRREDGAVRQQVVATLGRLEDNRAGFFQAANCLPKAEVDLPSYGKLSMRSGAGSEENQ
jgi:hypothetical protein